MMIAAFLCIAGSTALAADVDLTPALGGASASGTMLALPTNAGDRVFWFGGLPEFFRYDIRSAKKAYVGEKLIVATYAGPKVRVKTVSQNGVRGERLQLQGGYPAAARPLIAIAPNKLLVQSISGGFYPLQKSTKAPSRVFAISVVRLDSRGSKPNSDYLLPSDNYSWYEAVAARANETTGVIDVLVAHTIAGSSMTRLEAYRITDDTLTRLPHGVGPYAKVNGKTKRIWKTIALARGEWPNTAPTVAADSISGSVAFVIGQKVDVDGRRVALANVDALQFIDGKLYAWTRSNPDMKTVQRTFVWSIAKKKFDLVGQFGVAGVSANGKFWVKRYWETGKLILSPVPKTG